MNRVRYHNKKYQVLLTPTRDTDSNIEIMMGNWTDENLRNFRVVEFDTLQEAQTLALKSGFIDWDAMVLMYKSSYYNLSNLIQQIIYTNGFIVEFKKKYKTPDELKNAFFDRVIKYGDKFTLIDGMNDIISYHIINPWTKNLLLIADILTNEPDLRITKRFVKNGVIYLVGKIDLSTTYEICLWSSVLSQWGTWVYNHPNVSYEIKKDALQKALKIQESIDSNINLIR